MPQLYVTVKVEVEGYPIGFNADEYAKGFGLYAKGTALPIAGVEPVADSIEVDVHPYHESTDRYSCEHCMEYNAQDGRH